MVDLVVWTLGAILETIGMLCVLCIPPLVIALRRAENEDK